MSRCIYLHDGGVRCISQALPSGDFCEDHEALGLAGFEDPDEVSVHPLRKALLRLMAVLLLLMLMVPFYRVLSALFLEPSLSEDQRP